MSVTHLPLAVVRGCRWRGGGGGTSDLHVWVFVCDFRTLEVLLICKSECLCDFRTLESLRFACLSVSVIFGCWSTSDLHV